MGAETRPRRIGSAMAGVRRATRSRDQGTLHQAQYVSRQTSTSEKTDHHDVCLGSNFAVGRLPESGFGADDRPDLRDGAGVTQWDILLLEVPGDAAIHRAGIDIDVTEALRELARKGALARGGGAINGDNGMREVGHAVGPVLRTAVKKSAPDGNCE